MTSPATAPLRTTTTTAEDNAPTAVNAPAVVDDVGGVVVITAPSRTTAEGADDNVDLQGHQHLKQEEQVNLTEKTSTITTTTETNGLEETALTAPAEELEKATVDDVHADPDPQHQQEAERQDDTVASVLVEGAQNTDETEEETGEEEPPRKRVKVEETVAAAAEEAVSAAVEAVASSSSTGTASEATTTSSTPTATAMDVCPVAVDLAAEKKRQNDLIFRNFRTLDERRKSLSSGRVSNHRLCTCLHCEREYQKQLQQLQELKEKGHDVDAVATSMRPPPQKITRCSRDCSNHLKTCRAYQEYLASTSEQDENEANGNLPEWMDKSYAAAQLSSSAGSHKLKRQRRAHVASNDSSNNNNKKIVSFMLQKQEVVETKPKGPVFPDAILDQEEESQYALHCAVKYGYLEDVSDAIDEIMKSNVCSTDPPEEGEEGNSNSAALSLLNQTDSKRRTATDLAALTGQLDVVRLLREKGGTFSYDIKPRMMAIARAREAKSKEYLAEVRKAL